MKKSLFAIVLSALLFYPILTHAQNERVRIWPRIIIPPQAALKEPMQLKEMDVKARMVGLNVEVTTSMAFYNPNQRALEGELSFPLPDGAVVTGYALDVNGKMVDGVVVKKEKARVTFENEVRRGVDPGIIEQVAGNVYKTRIYPLPPQGIRRIQLRYVAELPTDKNGDAAWHLPLPIGETIEKLGIHIEISQGTVKPQISGFGEMVFQTFENRWVAEKEISNAKPGEDIWVALPKLPAQIGSVERTSDGDVYFAVNEVPDIAPVDMLIKLPGKIGIAWDASGSRAEADLQREFAMLKELISRWKPSEVVLLIFRDRPEDAVVFHGDSEAVLNKIKDAPRDGGTDLEALAKSMKAQAGVEQWLLFTDGFDTLSGALPNFEKGHVTAVVSQSVANRELLRQVCADSGGQVIDLQRLEPADAANAVMHPVPRLTGIKGSGVAEVQGIGKAAQGRVSIHGKLMSDETELSLEYSDGHVSAPVKLAKKNAPEGTLLASVWAGERINQLGVRAEENEEELLALGRRFGIVSPVTSLIVLENVDQYVRNDIEPPASLLEMRQQWQDRKNSIAKTEQQTRASKLDRVLAMWKARVDWWEKKFVVPPDFKWKGESGKDDEHAAGSVSHAWAAPVTAGNRTGAASHPDANGAAPSAPAAAAPLSTPAPDAGRLVDQERARAAAPGDGDAFGLSAGSSRPTIAGATIVASGNVFTGTAKMPEGESAPPESRIGIKPWDPSAPYLAALKAAAKEEAYKAYLEQRKKYAASPAFFLDCGDFFLRNGNAAIGIRVLTNLADLKLEDAPLLRVLAWRLQQAGELDRAITLFRKAGKLRSEEPQSLRDLALALAERGKVRHDVADISEAMKLLEKMIYGEWPRFEEIEVIGLEELNSLIAWSKAQDWAKAVALPALDERLLKNLDTDMRIVMSWDADNTDVDIHVVEPSGEEAFFSHNRTTIGGLVSRDFTQGYGPEEYMVRHAQPGTYKIFAHYFGSHQQTVMGPTTITATVFTDFGRPTEKKQVMTLRLDNPKDRADIGEIEIGGKNNGNVKERKKGEETSLPLRQAMLALHTGQAQDEVIRLLGEPQKKQKHSWIYQRDNHEFRIRFSDQEKVESVIEKMAGGTETILVQ